MTGKRALLLDLDGTLANSLGVMRDVYDRFLAAFGRRGEDAEFDALNGPPLAEVVRQLKRRHRLPGSNDELLDRYRSLLDEVYAAVPVEPGGEALVREARSAGWVTVVVTSAPSALARAWLRAAGIGDLVDSVVGGDTVERGKPHPDPYVAGLAAAGAVAARSLAVEDSTLGVAAALAAGVPTVLYRPDDRSDTATDEPGAVLGVARHLGEVAERLR